MTADLDFTRVERTSESYAPERSIRSEQLVEELSDSRSAEGIPGTLSNEPPRETAVAGQATEAGAAGSTPTRSSKREVRNYELDKTISHIREVPGSLRKLSVAVVVDYRAQVNEAGQSERLPLSEQQLAEVNALVREAVGFSEARGDSVNVVSAGFVAAPEPEALPEPSLLEQDWVWRLGKIAVAGLGLLLLVFAVLRPVMQAAGGPSAHRLAAPAAAPQGLLATGEGDGLGEDQVTLGQQERLGLPGGAPAYQQQLNMARSMVEKEPERVAHVVKGWVAADG